LAYPFALNLKWRYRWRLHTAPCQRARGVGAIPNGGFRAADSNDRRNTLIKSFRRFLSGNYGGERYDRERPILLKNSVSGSSGKFLASMMSFVLTDMRGYMKYLNSQQRFSRRIVHKN
jgi:hypothetical protein